MAEKHSPQDEQNESKKKMISTGVPAALGGMGATGPIQIVRKKDAQPEPGSAAEDQ